MKNHILFYITIVSVFSFNCFSQKTNVSPNKKVIGDSSVNTITMVEKKNNPEKKVKYYHVEENINMKFGGYTTTYDVTDPKLIRTYSLGLDNTRIVTPYYADEEQPKPDEIKVKADTLKAILVPKKAIVISNNLQINDIPKKAESFAYINIVKTYERMSNRGYKSIDMLKKLGNDYFFNDELEKAAKTYGELFSLTTNLEPEYYYRYSISLKAIGQNEKAIENLKKYNQLSGNQTK
jgi:tetratricopeptide (TPR) repeat protein